MRTLTLMDTPEASPLCHCLRVQTCSQPLFTQAGGVPCKGLCAMAIVKLGLGEHEKNLGF